MLVVYHDMQSLIDEIKILSIIIGPIIRGKATTHGLTP